MKTLERNRQIRLVSRPNGEPTEANFEIIDIDHPAIRPGKGELRVRVLYLSIDPYFRFLMGEVTPLIPSRPLNEVFGGSAVGEVVESNHPGFEVGDIALGSFGWQEYAVANGDEVQRVDPMIDPISLSLGLLGMTGLTAYFGMVEIGKPVPGETVVISGAAGAVGTAAGQIAKLKGCRVIGIAGSERKAQILRDEFGFDAVVDYRSTSDMGDQLHKVCPNGIDIYFDNVGGTITESVIPRMNRYARIALCGQISQYNGGSGSVAPTIDLPFQLWKSSALIKGFMLHDYQPLFGEALARLMNWYTEGKLINHEHIVEGFEHAPSALIGLFKGEYRGKVIVKVANR